MNYIHAHWSLPCFRGHGIANQVNFTTATVIKLTPHDPACHLGLPLLRRPCRVAVTTTAATPRSAARFDDLPPKRKKQQYVKPKPKPEPVVQQTRLAKALAAAGVASRRACEDLIAAGQVAVNGQVVSAQGSMIDPARDRVQVAGKAVDVRVKPVYYFALYKPPGYVCSQASRPGYEGLRAVDLLQPWLDEWSKKNERLGQLPPRLNTVGRLDVASEGLILLTNDGNWSQEVIHPSANITKEYLVGLDRQPSRQEVDTMAAGVVIDGTKVRPVEVAVAKVPRHGRAGTTYVAKVVVVEGKKHEPLDARSSSLGHSSGTHSSWQHHQGEKDATMQQQQPQASLAIDPTMEPPLPPASSSTQQPSSPQAQAAPTQHPSSPAAGADASSLPQLHSSALIVRDVDCQDMWLWNVRIWYAQRRRAQLRKQQLANAPATYRDGRPRRRSKKRPKPPRMLLSPPAGSDVTSLRILPALRQAAGLGAAEPLTVEQLRLLPPGGVRAGQQGSQGSCSGADTSSGVQQLVDMGDVESEEGEEEGEGVGDPADADGAAASQLGERAMRLWQLFPYFSVSTVPDTDIDAEVAALAAQQQEELADSLGMLLGPECFDAQGQLLPEAELEAVRQARELHAQQEMLQRQAELRSQLQQAVERYESAKWPEFCSRQDPDWQVRLLVAAAGLEVVYLKRTRVGGLRLPAGLEPGKYIQLSRTDLAKVTDQELQRREVAKPWP